MTLPKSLIAFHFISILFLLSLKIKITLLVSHTANSSKEYNILLQIPTQNDIFSGIGKERKSKELLSINDYFSAVICLLFAHDGMAYLELCYWFLLITFSDTEKVSELSFDGNTFSA